MDTKTSFLDSNMKAMGVALNDEQFSLLLRYYEMLIEKNKVMNLTAITDWKDVVIRHFTDSVSLIRILDPQTVKIVLDLGSGAGFPGIPLKIVFPHLDVVLVDSLGKRVRFLEEVISACELEKIRAVHGRAEDLAGQKTYREHFDLCVSRAVANLSTLSEYCLPFVKKGGSFVAYKSGKAVEEIEAARSAVKTLGGKPITKEDLAEFTLPGTDMGRTLIRIRKEKATPARYPRRAGIPTKEPL